MMYSQRGEEWELPPRKKKKGLVGDLQRKSPYTPERVPWEEEPNEGGERRHFQQEPRLSSRKEKGVPTREREEMFPRSPQEGCDFPRKRKG